jgi:TonB family protein
MRRALAIGALLAAAAGPAAAQDFAAAEASEVRFVDAVPAGPSVEERLEEIRRRIQAAVEYPPLARSERLEGEALVRFDIDAAGTAREVVLHRSSGRPSLDRAATRAVAAAAPLPWVYGRLEVPVRFSLDTRR